MASQKEIAAIISKTAKKRKTASQNWYLKVYAMLASHNAYMSGADLKEIAKEAHVSEQVVRKWIATVAHAQTGTDLPIDRIRMIRRQTKVA